MLTISYSSGGQGVFLEVFQQVFDMEGCNRDGKAVKHTVKQTDSWSVTEIERRGWTNRMSPHWHNKQQQHHHLDRQETQHQQQNWFPVYSGLTTCGVRFLSSSPQQDLNSKHHKQTDPDERGTTAPNSDVTVFVLSCVLYSVSVWNSFSTYWLSHSTLSSFWG